MMSRLVQYGSTDDDLVMLVDNALEGLSADFGREPRKAMKLLAGDGTGGGGAGDLCKQQTATQILRCGEKLALSVDTAGQ